MIRFYIISGVLIVIGSFFFVIDDLGKVDTFRNGKIIKVRVINVPNCISGKRHYYFKFEYNGKTHSKDVGAKFCDELKVNSFIDLKTNDEQTVFLYPKENPFSEIVSGAILFFFGSSLNIEGPD
jgi:hypothetical protein